MGSAADAFEKAVSQANKSYCNAVTFIVGIFVVGSAFLYAAICVYVRFIQ